MEAGLAVRAIQSVVAGLEALGHDPAELCSAAGIDKKLLDDREGRVGHSAAMRLWEEGVRRTGDGALGLHVAEAAPIQSFDVHAYALLSSATLREAFERACRYQRLIHDSTLLTLRSEGQAVVLRHALPGGLPVPRQPAEFLLTAYVRLGRLAAGQNWIPVEVRFAHQRPGDAAEHVRFFGSAPHFASGENAVVMDRDVIDAKNPRSDPGLLQVLDRYATDLLARLPRVGTLSERVRAHLLGAFSSGVPTSKAVAARLGLSERSLSRGLNKEGTRYKQLVDQLRRERATELLRDERTSIAEVAFLCGFSELSAFYRAFRRWTGQTPADYRAER